MSAVDTLSGIAQISSRTARFLPEPVATGVGVFNDAMKIVQTLGDKVIGGVPTAVDGDLLELLQLQLAAQQEMQTITMISNVERSKHESKMAAVRNIRVS